MFLVETSPRVEKLESKFAKLQCSTLRSCVDAGVSYEDRVARRKEEIESLQEALRPLHC